jgi:hypothetical protein
VIADAFRAGVHNRSRDRLGDTVDPLPTAASGAEVLISSDGLPLVGVTTPGVDARTKDARAA